MDKAVIVENIIGVICCLGIIVTSFYALVDILVIKKRYEKFLIGTTVAFLLNGLFGFPFFILILRSSGWCHQAEMFYVHLLVLSVFSLQFAHTLFMV